MRADSHLRGSQTNPRVEAQAKEREVKSTYHIICQFCGLDTEIVVGEPLPPNWMEAANDIRAGLGWWRWLVSLGRIERAAGMVTDRFKRYECQQFHLSPPAKREGEGG